MPTIKHILCPIDFSETSTHAAEQAVAIAGLYAAHISALHVCMPVMMAVPDGPLPEDPLSGHAAQSARDRIVAYFGPAKAAGVRVDVLIDVGDPAGDILDRAARLAPDVIVMGTHSMSGFEHLVLGSVTEKVL